MDNRGWCWETILITIIGFIMVVGGFILTALLIKNSLGG